MVNATKYTYRSELREYGHPIEITVIIPMNELSEEQIDHLYEGGALVGDTIADALIGYDGGHAVNIARDEFAAITDPDNHPQVIAEEIDIDTTERFED